MSVRTAASPGAEPPGSGARAEAEAGTSLGLVAIKAPAEEARRGPGGSQPGRRPAPGVSMGRRRRAPGGRAPENGEQTRPHAE